jgi:hypothetical protein
MAASILEHIKKMAVLIIACAVVGTVLLTLVFLLPVETMRQHVSESAHEILDIESRFEEGSLGDYIHRQKESYTDAIMVQNAVEKVDGRNTYEHAIWAYHYDLEEDVWTPEETLISLCDNDWNTDSMYLHEYARYWHGYLVYLKPLLLLFSWKTVVIIGIVFQIILMLLLVYLAFRTGNLGVAAVMAVGFAFMKPMLVLVSLTMSVCWIITLCAIIIMLLYHVKLENKKLYPELFCIIGIAVGYFDFLTFPVVTVGIPLCAYFIIEECTTLKKQLQKAVGYTVCWGIGYAGMWGMKWLIADCTLRTGTIKDALWSIIGRTEAIGGRSRFNGGSYVIGLNIQEYGSRAYFLVAALMLALVVIAMIISARYMTAGQIFARFITFAIIFAMPFAWIIAVQHHSALHARFTFRILSVSVAAVCGFTISLLKNIKACVNTKNRASDKQ